MLRADLGLMLLAALLGLGLACGSTSDGEAAAPDARTEASAGSTGMEGGSGGSTGGSGGNISASGGMGGTAGSTGGTAGSSDRDGSAGGAAPTADGAPSLDALVPPDDAGVAIRLDANVGGCVPLPDSPFCSGDRPVTWYCENFPVPDEFLSGPCMDAATALIRYCCPCSFHDVCR
jgi:hypothetical protein